VGLTLKNFREILDKVFVGKVGFLVNLSCGTSACDITQYCQEKGVFYIDTVKEEWAGHYANTHLELS
jgi:homospermidine synthase